MKNMRLNKNRISYILKGKNIEVQTTVLCAHMTADFEVNGKKISPYFYAPWYNDADLDCCNCDHELRGTFFAFPFGLNLPFNGIDYPCHGFSVDNGYLLTGESHENGIHTMTLKTELDEDHAVVERKYVIKDNENNIYQKNTITGAVGKYPVGYHPTLDIPIEKGSAIFDYSEPVETWTTPVPVEDYNKGGYCSLVPNYKIEDMTKVPIVYGGTVDLTRQPFIHGFDDIFMQLTNQENEFTWYTISIPSRGYLYYQFRNPRVLSNTLVWSSYGGRHYSPWYGKVDGCFEVAALNAYFHYGITAANENNPLSERGFRTYTEFDGSPMDFNLIEGVCEIPNNFEGVKDIVRDGEGKLKIIGKNEENISIQCDIDFIL